MNIYRTFTTTAIAAALVATPGLVSAEGLYGTAFLGWSSQAEDSKPYGDNIAIDPTFPDAFDSGDGGVGGLGLGYHINDQFRIEARISDTVANSTLGNSAAVSVLATSSFWTEA